MRDKTVKSKKSQQAFVLVYALALVAVIISITGFLVAASFREEKKLEITEESYLPRDLVENAQECFLNNFLKRGVFNLSFPGYEVRIPFVCTARDDGWHAHFTNEQEEGTTNVYGGGDGQDYITSVFDTCCRHNGVALTDLGQTPCITVDGLQNDENTCTRETNFLETSKSPPNDKARSESWRITLWPPKTGAPDTAECAVLEVVRECTIFTNIDDPDSSGSGSSSVCAGSGRTRLAITAYSVCNTTTRKPNTKESASHSRSLRYEI